jgi:hypothetical protein
MARNRAFERPQSTAEREASKLFQSADQKKGMTEHSLAQKAIRDNRERLKAERLAARPLWLWERRSIRGRVKKVEKDKRFFASGTFGFKRNLSRETRPGATHEIFSCTAKPDPPPPRLTFRHAGMTNGRWSMAGW